MDKSDNYHVKIYILQEWECSSFQQISSFFAKNYQSKVFWILTEGCKSEEILEWVGVFLFFSDFPFSSLILSITLVKIEFNHPRRWDKLF